MIGAVALRRLLQPRVDGSGDLPVALVQILPRTRLGRKPPMYRRQDPGGTGGQAEHDGTSVVCGQGVSGGGSGHGPVVIGGVGAAPGAVCLIHIEGDAPIRADPIVAAGLTLGVGKPGPAARKGLCRKGMTLLIIIIAHRLDLMLGTTVIRDAVVIAFVANETISIVENAGLMGVPIPAAIVKAIDILNTRASEEGKDHA